MNFSIEHAIAYLFILVAISHILHAKRWSDFFQELFQTAAPTFVIGMLTLPLGVVIVCTHNVWRADLSLIITLYGWAAVFKGSLYLLVPGLIPKLIANRIRKPASFAYAGSFLLVLGVLILYHAVTA
jgi:uncharacterized protein YjeT (DUF2065 family)